ncbi:Protein-L-isoaspartate O-methyltransferase [Platanthera guangdongensis]|uniref:Protein-L-isoaspartate O-methyltransferase n=1 Tax=Platanthera guangdongensis TaxID=2320717 RepID=A0ABR2MM11_9ASPA
MGGLLRWRAGQGIGESGLVEKEARRVGCRRSGLEGIGCGNLGLGGSQLGEVYNWKGIYGRLGWEEFAAYDAIHVGAAAPGIPEALIEQLKPGGRMVIPVGTLFQDLRVVDKMPDGSLRMRSETSVRSDSGPSRTPARPRIAARQYHGVFVAALPAHPSPLGSLPPIFMLHGVQVRTGTLRLLTRRFSTISLSSSSSGAAATSPSPSPPIDTHSLPESQPPYRVGEALTQHSLQWVSPSASCGELGLQDVGSRVSTLPDEYPEAHSTATKVGREWVVAIEGCVRARPTESVNEKMKTGAIEVAAEHVLVLNTVNCTLPFPITTSDDVKDNISEEIRLR